VRRRRWKQKRKEAGVIKWCGMGDWSRQISRSDGRERDGGPPVARVLSFLRCKKEKERGLVGLSCRARWNMDERET
jgi:hypothetical protein